MNKDRRARIATLKDTIDEAKGALETILDEERDAYDNLPESLQDSGQGQASQEAIDNLESALSGLDEALCYLDEAAG